MLRFEIGYHAMINSSEINGNTAFIAFFFYFDIIFQFTFSIAFTPIKILIEPLLKIIGWHSKDRTILRYNWILDVKNICHFIQLVLAEYKI